MRQHLNREQAAELYNLYHLARTALACDPPEKRTKYDRKLWAVREFVKLHPEYEAMQVTVYLTFERADAGLI